uniref:Ig-like domain-containing protein n=1 Tax=Leptobrachium leishanense TaxID=445787 RepID=A0A8C5R5B4_9ANUR
MSSEKDFPEQFSTTTVSTVAIQAGTSRIVVAILKCGELVNLQLAEAIPNLLEIGTNHEESKKLLEDHETLLYKLKALEDQVWDLLCEADKTAEENKDQCCVYDAMASTLKDAWDTLITALEKRRALIQLAAEFFQIAQKFSTSIDQAEAFLQKASGQDTADSITERLNQHQSHTKALLEHSLSLLNKSNELAECIDILKSNQSIANFEIAREARVSRSKMEGLLESLQDRRRQLDKQFRQQRKKLEEILQVSQWHQQEDKVTCWLRKHIDVYLKSTALGASLTENEELLHKHKEVTLTAKEWNATVERLKRESASIAASEASQEKEKITFSLDTLSNLYAEFWQLMTSRQDILQEANYFFKSVNKTFDKLGSIETYLKHLNNQDQKLPTISEKYAKAEAEIGTCTADAFQKGQALLSKSSYGSAMTGIQEMIGYLQKRVDQLTVRSTASSENSLKKHTVTLRQPLEENLRKVSKMIQELNSDLESYNDPGSTIDECEEVLDKLVELSSQAKEASDNMDTASQILNDMEQMAPSNAETFSSTISFLDKNLKTLDQAIEEKLEVIHVYIDFLKSSEELNYHILSLKKIFASNAVEGTVTSLDSVEAQLQSVLNEFFSVRDMGQNCLNIIKMMSKNTILNDGHAHTVESTMSNLIREKAELTSLWSNWQKHANQAKATKHQWKTIEEQLRSASHKLEELEEHELQPFSSSLCLGNDLQNIVSAQEKLNGAKVRFQLEILVKSSEEPLKALEVRNDVHLHKAHERQADITKLYNLILNLGTEIISINHCSKYISLPITDFQRQLQKLENESADWNSKMEKEKEKIPSLNFEATAGEVKELNESFKDLKKKINNLKFNYTKKADKGRNLKLIKNQIQQVEMYEEKMQVLKKKMDNLEKKIFAATPTPQMEKTDINQEAIRDLLKKVNNFILIVEEYKQNLEMAEDLHHIMEECLFWSEEACATVVRVGSYSAECKTRAGVEILLKQFNKFVEPTIPQQEERIQQMTNIARHVYGPDEGMKYVEKIITKHKETLHSVNELCAYLNELEEKLQEPPKMQEIPMNAASEAILSQTAELPHSAKDGSMLTDMDLPPESLAEEVASGDEYECISPDDISLPPLAETPESNLPQSETEQEEQPCYSSHSMHVSSYSLQMQVNASGKRVTDAGSGNVTPIAYTDISHQKRERTSSLAERFYSPTLSYKVESPSAHQSSISNEVRYSLNASPAKCKPNYSMTNQVHETHMQHHSVYTSMEKTEQLHVPGNTAKVKDRLHATPDEFSSLMSQSDPAKSCQRHTVTQEAIKSFSEKHSSSNVACQSPVSSKHLPNVTVKEGSPVTLEVEVTSCPEPTLTWYRTDHKPSTDSEEETKQSKVTQELCKKDPGHYITHRSISNKSFCTSDGTRWEDNRSPLSEIDWISLLFVYLCISLTYWLYTNTM